MDSWCGKLLTSILLLPFTAGNYRRRQNGSGYYDCIISSRVLFLVVLSIVIVFTASKKIPTHSEIRIGFVLILLSLLMIFAVIGFCVQGYLVHKHGLQYIVAASRNASTPKLQVVFLWLFGFASVFYCGFFIIKQIECSENLAVGNIWYILLYFNITLILCLFSQMVIITHFSPYELKQTHLVNYAMSLLLVANVCMFVYGTLIGEITLYIMYTFPDSDIANCLENNSTFSVLLEKSKPILKPNFTEFCLLSCTILLEIWSPTKKVQLLDEETSYMEIDNIEHTERSPLLPTFTATEHRRSGNEGKQTACQLITLVFSITAGLGLIVCYVVMAMNIGDIDYMRNVAEIYELALKVVMVLAIFIGFYCLVSYCTPDTSPEDLKPSEYVYLLSAFGLFMMHICEGIGGDVSFDNWFMSTSILSIFQDYLQVVFLLHASRFKKSEPQSTIHLLESALIFIMICNCIFWLNDSFLKSEFSITRILEHYNFPTELSSVVYNVLLPVSVFFRFTSFLEYYATFDKYNK
ncbi:uncharacterized protein LOC110465885 isoform X2 [Mizuhopecten yessoensis]|uniref:Otopetrin-2 n=2 Tax=Mizuhopecten yessoensis TaxID=6573 RepID=A0A210PQQ3_MIZYE|nr:uncharacterized protein LOC110465885 isoform X2 [Mizuhopecten yessoensis]XP_021377691.1 uncharacterized protein LOC110465885 isoform X2 [Mizuhopecten yessoensis]OWF38811.1 hypothetical protein KP79_PYT16695 [Mizuhopecten yessoensis]